MSRDSPLSETPETAEMYYIQNVGYCGNCLKWWRAGGRGYTANLDEAWLVDKAKADSICSSRPKEDIPWPQGKALAASERHVCVH